ncbi:MAG: hypothetical protein QXS02_06445, partial [Candidatus Thermoplasmatota archaeon]
MDKNKILKILSCLLLLIIISPNVISIPTKNINNNDNDNNDINKLIIYTDRYFTRTYNFSPPTIRNHTSYSTIHINES